MDVELLEKYSFRMIAPYDEAAVERLRQISGEQSSSYSFPVLFCWQEMLKLSIFVNEDCFIVKYGMAGEQDYFFPCGKRKQIKEILDRLMCVEKKVRLHFVSERNKKFLSEEYGEQFFEAIEDRSSFDYLIKTEKFLALRGKEYSKIRYYINKARRSNNIRFLILQPRHLEEVRLVGRIWESAQEIGEIADEDAEQKALDNFVSLHLSGLLFRKNGKPVGYIIGKFINEDTFDIHFMKKIPEEGRIDFYMLYILSRLIKGYARYLNLEDDMGHEGLRQKKMLYRPDGYNKVYVCTMDEMAGKGERQQK